MTKRERTKPTKTKCVDCNVTIPQAVHGPVRSRCTPCQKKNVQSQKKTRDVQTWKENFEKNRDPETLADAVSPASMTQQISKIINLTL